MCKLEAKVVIYLLKNNIIANFIFGVNVKYNKSMIIDTLERKK